MSQPQFKTPPSSLNSSGDERCVGYEFEFTGVEISEAAKMVQRLYGGTVSRVSTYEYHVEDASFGT